MFSYFFLFWLRLRVLESNQRPFNWSKYDALLQNGQSKTLNSSHTVPSLQYFRCCFSQTNQKHLGIVHQWRHGLCGGFNDFVTAKAIVIKGWRWGEGIKNYSKLRDVSFILLFPLNQIAQTRNSGETNWTDVSFGKSSYYMWHINNISSFWSY